MSRPTRISYLIMAVLLLAIGWLHIATLTLTVLFGYFALQTFSIGKRKWLGLTLYGLTVLCTGFALSHYLHQAYVNLPSVAENAINQVVTYADNQGIELPFTDLDSLKVELQDYLRNSVSSLGHYAHDALLMFGMLIIGLVVAVSLFLNARWSVEGDPLGAPDSVYGAVVHELSHRFRLFYRSFATVMGAQIIISAINTVLTGAFLVINHYPRKEELIVLTFLCGLLPIIGNLISNILIVAVGFTIADRPHVALYAFVFLILVHKGEYFFNSKIVGERIKNPMWLTLIGLVIGEKLMGIPGMILAPVVLHYIKVEASRNKVSDLTRTPFKPSTKTSVPFPL